MLKYLVIMLDDTSVSYCNYENRTKAPKLIGLEDLKAGIVFAMKRNLTVQFVYPDYELPQEYKEAVDSIDHCKIVPYGYGSDADVVVLDHPDRLAELSLSKSTTYLLRSSKNALFKSELRLGALLGRVHRLNLLLTDIQTFTDADFQAYSRFLGEAAEDVLQLFLEGKSPQLNVLTDRLFLGAMNTLPSLRTAGSMSARHSISTATIVSVTSAKDWMSRTPVCTNCSTPRFAAPVTRSSAGAASGSTGN